MLTNWTCFLLSANFVFYFYLHADSNSSAVEATASSSFWVTVLIIDKQCSKFSKLHCDLRVGRTDFRTVVVAESTKIENGKSYKWSFRKKEEINCYKLFTCQMRISIRVPMFSIYLFIHYCTEKITVTRYFYPYFKK